MKQKTMRVFAWIGAIVPLILLATIPFWKEFALGLGRCLPPCYFYSLTGIPCPGCGLTRSVISLLRGDVLTAMRYNLMPFFLVVIILPLWLELWFYLFYRPIKLLPRSNWFIYGMLGLYLIYIVIRNFIPALQLFGT